MRINLSQLHLRLRSRVLCHFRQKTILTEVYNDHKKIAHNAKGIRLANSSFCLSWGQALKLSQLLNLLHAWKLKNLTSLTQWHKDIVLTNCNPGKGNKLKVTIKRHNATANCSKVQTGVQLQSLCVQLHFIHVEWPTKSHKTHVCSLYCRTKIIKSIFMNWQQTTNNSLGAEKEKPAPVVCLL